MKGIYQLRRIVGAALSMGILCATAVIPTAADAPTLTLEKSVFTQGEEILARYTGASGKDWIGIYKEGELPGGPQSTVYAYTSKTGQPNGTMDFQDADAGDVKTLVPGNYNMYLFKDDGYSIAAACDFTLLAHASDGYPAPKAVEYERASTRQGYADGSVTVTPPEHAEGLTGYRLYWGNSDGIFKNYTEIPVPAVSGGAAHKLNDNTMVPYGATRLYAVAVYGGETESSGSAYVELPKGVAAVEQKPLYSFQVFSDAHITTDPNHLHNRHLRLALEDIKKNDPDSIGIFNVGDVADEGAVEQYRQYNDIVNSVTGIPYIYCTPGNHDLRGADYTKEINDFLEGTNAPNAYYSKTIGDATFIMLGSQAAESYDYHAQLNKDQLEFLKAELGKASNGMNPVFVFLHQPLYNTVSGSLPGQNWHGVYQDKQMRAIFKQYPQAIFLTGHTHWEMDSKSPMYAGNGLDANMFNDAAVGYLWTDQQTAKEGSQGYYVEVYADKVLVRGRDFFNGKWVSNAQFIVDITKNIKGLTVQLAAKKDGLIGQAGNIEALLRDIETLTGNQAKEYSAEKATLTGLLEQAKAQKTRVEEIKAAITVLPGAAEITLSDKEAVGELAALFAGLTDEQKALVGEEFAEKLADLVKAVENLRPDDNSAPAHLSDPETSDDAQSKSVASAEMSNSNITSSQEAALSDTQSGSYTGGVSDTPQDNPNTAASALWGMGLLLLASGCCLAYGKMRYK